MLNNVFKVIITLGVFLTVSCSNSPKIIDSQLVSNSKASLQKPYLILISLDGFRWDYVERFKPPNLTQFIADGVQTKSLIPSYPSKTFPNHYSIVTGLLPDNHGIIGNKFHSPELNEEYILEEGRFYGGKPIWVHAAQSGMVSASYFFLGSEAEIQGIRPNYYYKFDMETKKETRVTQVLDWLKLPEKKRPHMITMYFPDMDNVGHWYGPNDDEKLKGKLFELDNHLGNLFNGINKSSLPINVIIVSDHGMSDIHVDKYISIDLLKNKEQYRTVNNGSMVNIHLKKPNEINSIHDFLNELGTTNNFKVYKTKNTPNFDSSPTHSNWGELQIIPNKGYYFSSAKNLERRKKTGRTIFGQHGFQTNDKNMHGIFYAKGPNLKAGLVVPSVKNIHIFPLMCEILDIPQLENIDGNLSYLQEIIKK